MRTLRFRLLRHHLAKPASGLVATHHPGPAQLRQRVVHLLTDDLRPICSVQFALTAEPPAASPQAAKTILSGCMASPFRPQHEASPARLVVAGSQALVAVGSGQHIIEDFIGIGEVLDDVAGTSQDHGQPSNVQSKVDYPS
jgi:hypothetical protein